MSVAVWSMMGLAFWHVAVFVPPRFWGGIVGALGAAVTGALLAGFLLPVPGVSSDNPPGIGQVLWAVPGSLGALALSYTFGARLDRARGIDRGP